MIDSVPPGLYRQPPPSPVFVLRNKNINEIHLLWFAIGNRYIANNDPLNDKVHYSSRDYKLETSGWV